jgi:hypothetical protein
MGNCLRKKACTFTGNSVIFLAVYPDAAHSELWNTGGCLVKEDGSMNLSESEFGIFEKEILAAGIFVETVSAREFRIHVNLEEGRIVAVKQIAGPPVPEGETSDPFAKYKIFMK